jgi:hypothetical protein
MATVLINNNTPVFTTDINLEIIQEKRGVNINSILPFRIRFTAIQIPTSIANIPAIPLQIIGFSNYIL